jgi:hypothetical protein
MADEEELSLVERIFPDPDTVCEGEYIAIHEFLLNPDICDDPELIAGVLQEFSAWAEYMVSVQLGKNGCALQVSKGRTIDENRQLASESDGGKLSV